MRGGPWVETESTRAFEEQLAGLEVLDIGKSGMKFNKNLIIMCKLVNRYKVFSGFLEHGIVRVNENCVKV